MCYAGFCNPACDGCRPRCLVEVRCPSFGNARSMTRAEYIAYFKLPHKKGSAAAETLKAGDVPVPLCAFCRTDLTEAFEAAVEPADCRRSRVVCGFLCDRRNEPYHDGERPCDTMVPLGRIAERSGSPEAAFFLPPPSRRRGQPASPVSRP